LLNVHCLSSKLYKILLLMTKKNSLEIGEIHLKKHLNAFGSNILLIMKIMNFENVSLTKVFIFMSFKTSMHNINEIDWDVYIYI
jgi:hypothetical protein